MLGCKCSGFYLFHKAIYYFQNILLSGEAENDKLLYFQQSKFWLLYISSKFCLKLNSCPLTHVASPILYYSQLKVTSYPLQNSALKSS